MSEVNEAARTVAQVLDHKKRNYAVLIQGELLQHRYPEILTPKDRTQAKLALIADMTALALLDQNMPYHEAIVRLADSRNP